MSGMDVANIMIEIIRTLTIILKIIKKFPKFYDIINGDPAQLVM